MDEHETHTQEALVRLDFDGDPTNISQTFDEYLVGSWLGSWHLYLYCNCLTITSKLISGLMKLTKKNKGEKSVKTRSNTGDRLVIQKTDSHVTVSHVL